MQAVFWLLLCTNYLVFMCQHAAVIKIFYMKYGNKREEILFHFNHLFFAVEYYSKSYLPFVQSNLGAGLDVIRLRSCFASLDHSKWAPAPAPPTVTQPFSAASTHNLQYLRVV